MQRRSNTSPFFVMEKAVVLFKNPETKDSIEINLVYNKENSDLDYTLNLSEGYSLNSNMDFVGFLAHMFLTSLQVNKD